MVTISWPLTPSFEVALWQAKLWERVDCPDDNGNEILSRLSAGSVHQLPVVEKEKVQGIPCRTSALRFLHIGSELGV